MAKQTILSGMQPSGKLHIGNYLGALHNFVVLQKTHKCFFMIADLHALTQDYDPKKKPAEILELGAEFLAAGLDPKKATLFIQSYVAEHAELTWIFNCLAPLGELERMTQFKDKAKRQTQNINAGLFIYPVLQAVDILLYKPDAVPVGQDQDQHLELTRGLAKRFNSKFGDTFPEPKTLHTEIPRIMSLLEPEKKMSKSLGENHVINISDEPKIIQQKLARAVSDGGDGQSPGGQNLLRLCQIFCQKKISDQFFADAQAGKLRYGDLKAELGQALAEQFAGFRKRKAELIRSPKKIEKIFAVGSAKAAKVAQQTMTEVRKKIGLR